MKRVLLLPQVTLHELSEGRRNGGEKVEEVQLRYSNMKDFMTIAKEMKIMHEPRVCISWLVSAIPLFIIVFFLFREVYREQHTKALSL